VVSKVYAGMDKTKNRKSVIHTGMLRALEQTMEKGNTMSECMMFPNSWGEFLDDYSFKDKEEVYTNGSMLIPTFRVEQMVEHYFGSKWIPVSERLPEKNKQWVLCLCIGGAMEVLKFDYAMRNWDSQYPRRCYMESYVTHWMPLPNPPKEDN
jgi:hypothetical protein